MFFFIFDDSLELEKIKEAENTVLELGFKISPEWGCLEKIIVLDGWSYRITIGFSLYDGTVNQSGIGKFWFWAKSSGHKIGNKESIETVSDSAEKALYNTYGIEPTKTKLDRYNYLSLRCGREDAFLKAVEEIKELERRKSSWEEKTLMQSTK